MADKKRDSTDFEKEVFEYLDDLRESGVTNMFGAAPYIQECFGVKKIVARRLLKIWTKNFGKTEDYGTIIDDGEPIDLETA